MILSKTSDVETLTQIDSPGCPAWDSVVAGVASNNAMAIVSLYRFLNDKLKSYVYFQLGRHDAEDCLHDVFMSVVSTIQRGELRQACALPAFANTVVRRKVAAVIEEKVRKRASETPIDDALAIPSGSTSDGAHVRAVEDRVMKLALRQLCARDREILHRFYVLEQSREQICSELNLTETQFRVIKSRAKAKFAEIGRDHIRPRAILTSVSTHETGLRTHAC